LHPSRVVATLVTRHERPSRLWSIVLQFHCCSAVFERLRWAFRSSMSLRPCVHSPSSHSPQRRRHFVKGVSVIRGTPIPVLDMARLFGGHETTAGRFVTVRVANRIVAMAFDGVVGVRSIPKDSLRALPPLIREPAADAVGAIGTLDAELLVVLTTARILHDDVLADLGLSV
jgi:purine-binding chemotaxis protein CheW